MHISFFDELMREAISLAKLGTGHTRPNPLVGAVIAIDGKVVGRGYHKRCGEPHAEVNAIADATANGVRDFSRAALCVTLEPCSHTGRTPPCADLVISTGIKTVACGMVDPNPLVAGKGIARLKAAGVEVRTGVLETECRAINRPFIKYITTGRPYATLKLAISLDGKIATASGDSRWISCEESRADVHRIRAENAAVICGIGTARADDPMLNVRLFANGTNERESYPSTNPIRIVVDSRFTLPMTSRLVRTAREIPLIVAGVRGENSAERRAALEDAGAATIECAEKNGRVDIADLMKNLGGKGIDSALIEGGSALAWSALEAGAIDRARFYIAPMLIGGNGAPGAIGGSGSRSIADAFRLEAVGSESIGTDIVIEGDVCSRG
jgi:diaminohydroxyphosphoribosylaminopyrimidine deaminase/5-amino-6-(5-phosphoribosylamino)uracil reductase